MWRPTIRSSQLPFALFTWIIIAIEHNSKSNNNYNRNYALSISKFNKWFESGIKIRGNVDARATENKTIGKKPCENL